MEGDEVDENSAMPRAGDFDVGLGVAGMAGKGKWKLMPVGFGKCERSDAMTFPSEPRMRRVSLGGVFSLAPKRTFVFSIGLKKDASLPDTCISPVDTETDALLAVLEIDLGDFDMAMLRAGFPICLEVRTFGARAMDLFGKETVFDRVIDVLQELAVDAFVDGYGRAIRINHKNGNAGFVCCNAGIRGMEESDAVAASVERIRKLRRFIRSESST